MHFYVTMFPMDLYTLLGCVILLRVSFRLVTTIQPNNYLTKVVAYVYHDNYSLSCVQRMGERSMLFNFLGAW